MHMCKALLALYSASNGVDDRYACRIVTMIQGSVILRMCHHNKGAMTVAVSLDSKHGLLVIIICPSHRGVKTSFGW